MKMPGNDVVSQKEFLEFKRDFTVAMQLYVSRMHKALLITTYSCVALAIISMGAVAYSVFK